MKLLWTTISFTAVVNLLALGMFAGWLHQTGRIDMGRVEAVRELFRLPVEEASRLAEKEAAERAADLQREAEAYRVENPLPAAARQIEHMAQLEARSHELQRRAVAETEQMREQLLAAQRRHAEDRTAFDRERAAWREQTEAMQAGVRDAQFRRVVGLLEQLRPKQAKDLVTQWATGGDIDQAVRYLNAMNPRIAARVLAEFKDDQTQVARELLERLRTLGQTTGGSQESLHAPTSPADD